MPPLTVPNHYWFNKGVRYKKFKCRDHRFGVGKVHLAFWDRLNKMWVPVCGYGASAVHLTVTRDTELTCTLCNRSYEGV